LNELLEAALRYAEHGWHVFPIKPGAKTPLTHHGVKDAVVDADQIRSWWAKWPDANIAVACGAISGIYVIDVDVTEDGSVNGYDSLGQLSDRLPATVMQTTPRGGCHAFFRSDTAPANRNGFLPGVDIRGDGYYVLLAPSIGANGNRYKWGAGLSPDVLPLAVYPEFMRPVPSVASSPAPAPMPTIQLPRLGVAWRDELEVASRYLALIDPAVQGQAGHDKLFWACGCMTWGCGLPFDKAYEILAAEYNPRCVPPWDLSNGSEEHDFRRKIAESIKRPPRRPRHWILDDPAYAAEPLTEIRDDVAAMVVRMSWENHSLTYTDVPSASELTKKMVDIKEKDDRSFLTQPTGLFGDLCSWINATAFKPQPYLTLGCALAFMGVLFGRKVKDTLGSRTNLYVMSVAPSSAGKNHAMNKIRELCMAADCVDLLGGSDIASDTAIESRVALKPATLFMLDEIGHLLVSIKSGVSNHQAQIVSALMQLYSAAPNIYLGREYADAENQRVIVQPCLCIYGVATPEKFASGLSSSELNDGWLSRCLVFYVKDEPRKRRDTDLTAPPPQRLVELVSAWAKRAIIPVVDGKTVSQFVVGSQGSFKEPPPVQLIVQTNPDAENRFRSFDDMAEVSAKKDRRLSSSWLKAEENARRIALIIACSDSYDNPVVDIAAADRACRMVSGIVSDFGTYVVPAISDGRVESEKQQILRVIKSFGVNGCRKRDITRRTRGLNNGSRNDRLADLKESQEVICRPTPKSRVETFWTAENFPGEIDGGENE
jgi:hypothetical protein